MTTTKATIIDVNYAGFLFKGICLPDGETRGFAIPQIADLFGTPKNYATQSFKRLLGEEFRPHKIAVDEVNQKVNFISIQDFKRLLRAMDKAGNPVAERISEAEDRIRIYIEDFDFTVEEAIEKLTTVKKL